MLLLAVSGAYSFRCGVGKAASVQVRRRVDHITLDITYNAGEVDTEEYSIFDQAIVADCNAHVCCGVCNQ